MKLSQVRIGALLTVSVAGPLLLLFWLGAFSNVSDRITDFLFTRAEPPAEVLILQIDDASIREIGQWPWPRAVFGEALRRLSGASAIGIDVNFKEPSRVGSYDDALFAEALTVSGAPVILATEILPEGRESPPLRAFTTYAETGFANVEAERDGVVRRFSSEFDGKPSFAMQLAKVSNPNISLPIIHGRGFYFGPAGTFSHAAFRDLLSGALPQEFFKDKIVLMGATASDLQDYRETPFGLMSGVEIQANMIGAHLQGKDFSTPNATSILIILFAILSVFIGLRFERGAILFGSAIFSLFVYNILVFVAFDKLVLFDTLYPNLAIIFGFSVSFGWRYLTTLKERRFIRDSFSRYVAPEVVDELVRNPEKLKLGGERRELTILFSDIRGFTSLSETMDPERLTKFLNRYLTAMSNVILAERGVIDKYIGDAVMAIWGAPLVLHDHPARAVRAAIAMTESLRIFNSESQKRGDPEIKIGIGLNTGEVTVGNLGSDKRFDYTVIGDAVNLASRLESLTKMYGVSILLSGHTVSFLTSESLPRGYAIREIDRVRVKGKNEPITMFEIVRTADYEPIRVRFEEGLHAYYRGDFQTARENFESVLRIREHDGPTRLLRERCGELVGHAGKWDGAYTLTSK